MTTVSVPAVSPLHERNYHERNYIEQGQGVTPYLYSPCLSFEELYSHQKKIQNHDAQFVYETLLKTCEKLIEEGAEHDPISLIEKLSNDTSLDIIKNAFLTNDSPEDLLETAHYLQSEAEKYLRFTQSLPKNPYHTHLQDLLDSAITTLETILTTFGIADFFKKAEDDAHSSLKFHKISSIAYFFSFLSATLFPLLGLEVGCVVLGVIFLSISALSLIYPYFRPLPRTLPKAQNWTTLYHKGLLTPPEGRDSLVKDVARVLITENALIRQHPMLIGKAGIGKTEIIKALVQAIENKNFPELIGKKVFYINTAKLINDTSDYSDSRDVFEKISSEMGRHKDDIILVFDEIQNACKGSSDDTNSGQLKMLFDEEGDEIFPHVIGITTEEEYHTNIENNQAFSRRFKVIKVENTSFNQTLDVIQKKFLQKAPSVPLETEVLEYLIKETTKVFTKNAPQPAKSLSILSQCIYKTDNFQPSLKEKEKTKKHEEIQRLTALLSQDAFSQKAPHFKESISIKMGEVVQLNKKIEQETLKKLNLRSAKKTLLTIKQERCKTISALARGIISTQQYNRFILLTNAIPILTSLITNQAQKLHTTMTITKELVDQVIQEEKREEARLINVHKDV